MKAKHKKQSSSKGTVLKTKIGIAFALGVFCVVFTALMGCSAKGILHRMIQVLLK